MNRNKKDWKGPVTGNALKDGYTVTSKRPRSASGGMVLPDRADAYDEQTDFLVEMGGRRAAQRRLRELKDDGDDAFDPYY